MGYVKHHAIVVTDWNAERCQAAHAKAIEMGFDASEILYTINCTASFLVAPDGSKEGWDESDAFDVKREQFRAYLREATVDFVEVAFGGDFRDAAIIEHADMLEEARARRSL